MIPLFIKRSDDQMQPSLIRKRQKTCLNDL